MNSLYIAPDVVEDYDSGLEYGTAARVLRMVQRGDEREFLIQCAAPPLRVKGSLSPYPKSIPWIARTQTRGGAPAGSQCPAPV